MKSKKIYVIIAALIAIFMVMGLTACNNRDPFQEFLGHEIPQFDMRDTITYNEQWLAYWAERSEGFEDEWQIIFDSWMTGNVNDIILPTMHIVSYMMDLLIMEYRDEAGFDLMAELARFEHDYVDLLGFVYNMATDMDVIRQYFTWYGEVWLYYMIELTILDFEETFSNNHTHAEIAQALSMLFTRD